jgi:hypothetical protein
MTAMAASESLFAEIPITHNAAVLSSISRHRVTELGPLPVAHWHACIGDATIADAILDRIMRTQNFRQARPVKCTHPMEHNFRPSCRLPQVSARTVFTELFRLMRQRQS